MDIFIQVNTSGEEQKSGVEPENCLNLIKDVQEKCSQINIKGLMTIGKLDGDATEDFKVYFYYYYFFFFAFLYFFFTLFFYTFFKFFFFIF